MRLTDTAFEETAKRLEHELTTRLESVRSFPVRFTREVKAVFEGVPTLSMIRWTQYTPYFNDGDSCEFSINDPTFIRDTKLQELQEDDLYAWDAKHHLPADQAKLIENLAQVMEDSEDSLRACFGDHSEIRIFRDGTVSVDGYDHD